MALRPNPVTGQLEEDGLPEQLDPFPAIEAPISEFQQGGAGGAGVPPVNVQVGPATKPLQEVETTQRLKSPEVVAAEKALVSAEQATDKAQGQVSNIAQQEAQITAEGATDRADAKAEQLNVARLDEQDRQARVQANLDADTKEIEQEKQARLAAGNAAHTFWEGRPVAKFFTTILQIIGGVAHGLAGGEGPSAADRALKEAIDGHRNKLVNDWQATKEANALKRANRTAYEAELERRRIAANNQSLLELDMLEEQTKARLAGLGKDKQAAADQLAAAKTEEARRALRLENAEGYNRLQKITSNSYAPGAPPAPLATVADVKEKSSTEASAKQYAELADLIEKNPESWENYKTALRRQEREDATLGAVPAVGKPLVGLGRALDAATGIGGQTPEQKLVNTGDKAGAEIQRRTEAILFEKAKEGGGTVTAGDLEAAIKRLGAQGSSAKEFAASLRETAARRGAEAKAMEGVRSFGPNGTSQAQPIQGPAKRPATNSLEGVSEARLRAGAEAARKQAAEAKKAGKSDPEAMRAYADFMAALGRLRRK